MSNWLFPGDRDIARAYIIIMDTILPILLGAAMLVTLGVLCAGVISFAFNTKANAKYSNTLMTARVICQAVAVAIFGLMVLLQAL
jgi:Hypoxia induced protein conserved region